MINYINNVWLDPPENTEQIVCFDGISKSDNKERIAFGLLKNDKEIMKFVKSKDESYQDYVVKLKTISEELNKFADYIKETHF